MLTRVHVADNGSSTLLVGLYLPLEEELSDYMFSRVHRVLVSFRKKIQALESP